MSRALLTVASLFAVAACSVPQPALRRVEAPPPRVEVSEVERTGARSATPVDPAASDRYLEEEANRRREELPENDPLPQQTVYVEVPVEVPVERRVYYRDHYEPRHYDVVHYGPSYGYRSHYRHHGYYGHRHHRGHAVLGRTLVGAGLGAIIGHQSGRRDKGAAIGAGIGFLSGLLR